MTICFISIQHVEPKEFGNYNLHWCLWGYFMYKERLETHI